MARKQKFREGVRESTSTKMPRENRAEKQSNRQFRTRITISTATPFAAVLNQTNKRKKSLYKPRKPAKRRN